MKILINRNNFIYILFSFFVALIVANRGATRDTSMYYNIFINIYDFPLLSPLKFYNQAQVEVGFGWLSFIIRTIGLSEVFLFFLISLFTFLSIYKIAKELNENNKINSYIFIVLIYYLSSGYFLMQQFMQIRQGLSIPIAFLAISLLFNRKRILFFLLFSFLAICLHQSSIAVLFVGVWLFIFSNIKVSFSIKEFKILLILFLIVSVFLLKFLILDILVQLSNRLIAYSYSQYSEARGFWALPNIKSLILFMLIIFLMDDKLYDNRLLRILVVLYTVGLSIRLGFSDFGVLSGRLGVVFTISEIFILPFLLFRFKNLKFFLFLLYIIFQTIITYIYQAPYILEDYFKPLY